MRHDLRNVHVTLSREPDRLTINGIRLDVERLTGALNRTPRDLGECALVQLDGDELTVLIRRRPRPIAGRAQVRPGQEAETGALFAPVAAGEPEATTGPPEDETPAEASTGGAGTAAAEGEDALDRGD